MHAGRPDRTSFRSSGQGRPGRTGSDAPQGRVTALGDEGRPFMGMRMGLAQRAQVSHTVSHGTVSYYDQ